MTGSRISNQVSAIAGIIQVAMDSIKATREFLEAAMTPVLQACSRDSSSISRERETTAIEAVHAAADTVAMEMTKVTSSLQPMILCIFFEVLKVPSFDASCCKCTLNTWSAFSGSFTMQDEIVIVHMLAGSCGLQQ